MANLFLKQAKHYAAARPDYPAELFQFIASKTARHDLAWDVGTGSGQAAVSVSLPPQVPPLSIPAVHEFLFLLAFSIAKPR
ncbi:unnamed protein product [Triticum turgidum subsp. durum]|uniref:SAM-dependent methyltransferase n=1 Tax=Triticum turgidum subsp. durum TaxID=4567 RepID=A0A9R1PCH8_TRITD|nr:unnamed protein product [Triticum turgidum subsp. durum]